MSISPRCLRPLLAAVLLAASPGLAQPPEPTDPREIIAGAEEIRPDGPARLAEEVDRRLAAAFPAGRPGAALVLVAGGEVLLRRGYGGADPQAAAALDPGRGFPLGALAEPFSAVVALQLAEEGVLSLSAPVAELLPASAGTPDRRITLHHLLTHTSGLTDAAGAGGGESLAALVSRPPAFPPGEDWRPSEANRRLTAAVLAEAAGRPFGRLVEERIFRPLEMTASAAGAAGGLVSSLDDLARFAAALAAGRLLSPESRRRLVTAASLPDGRSVRYGPGWAVWHDRGRRLLQQDGGGAEDAVSLVVLPDDELVAAVHLARPAAGGATGDAATGAAETGGDAGRLAVAAVTRLAGMPIDDPLGVLLRPEVLESYVGRYEPAAEPGRTWVVTRRGLQLFIAPPGGEPRPALAVREDDLTYAGEPVRFTFRRDGDGRVTALVISRHRGPDEVALRRPPAAPDLSPEPGSGRSGSAPQGASAGSPAGRTPSSPPPPPPDR